MAVEELVGWDWGAMSRTIIGAGIGTAGVQGAIAWYKDRRDREVHAAYLALRIAVSLEAFADTCLDTMGDKELAESSDGHAGGFSTKLPEAPQYPADDSGWRSLKPVLAEKALTFPGKLTSAQRGISFMLDVADQDSGFEACYEACGRLGLEAFNLAVELRATYRFPEFELRGAERLRRTVSELDARSSPPLPKPPSAKAESSLFPL